MNKTFFNYSVPPLRRKQVNLDLQEHQGLWLVEWRFGKYHFYSTFYTRIDQACLLWSLLLFPMFFTAQFLPISWTLQAGCWSVLSLLGTIAMVSLVHYWVKIEQVSWVLVCWVMLMTVGLILTDLGIFLGWGEVLSNLCQLWLGLSALGYFCTGLAVRSRAIIVIGLVHLLAILVLPYVGSWLFLLTGTVMVLSLLLLAEFQWDMRLPATYGVIASQQTQFNSEQHHLSRSI